METDKMELCYYYTFEKIFNFDKNSTEDAPVARSGHRTVVSDGYLYSVGGYNPEYWDVQNDNHSNYPLFRELWKFNLVKKKWTKLSTTGPMPYELASHSAVLRGHLLFVYGGTGIPFGTAASNSTYVCNLDTLVWKEISCHGDHPIKTYGHGMVIHKNHIFIYGGTTGWEYNSEMHRLDLSTCCWEYLQSEKIDVPEGRYRHEMVYWKGKIMVFGGGRSNAVFSFDKIAVFDTETHIWNTVFAQPSDQIQMVYLCGGYNGQIIFDDLWRFDLDLLKWQLLPHKLSEPVYFHSSAITNCGCLIVFGGVTHIDEDRTADVWCVQVEPPTLKQAAWLYICQRMSHLIDNTDDYLRHLGVPTDLIEQLK